MMRRTLGFFATMTMVAALQSSALAADSILSVTFGGRPLTAGQTGTGAIVHDGIVYVDVVKMTRALAGLVVFGKNDAGRTTVDVTLPKGTIEFAIGSATASYKNGGSLAMPAPSVLYDGNFFVPVKSFAAFSGIAFARHGSTLALTPPPSAVSQAATPAASGSPAASDDEPSPAEALSVVPSASADEAGLHLHLSVTNTTGSPYVLAFPNGAQFAFIVVHNGSDAYDSLSNRPVSQGATTLTFAPKETKLFDNTWTGYANAGPGRYLLRVRLMTANPIDFPPVSLGTMTPAPGT